LGDSWTWQDVKWLGPGLIYGSVLSYAWVTE
jgi:hypothetical protein